MQEKCSNGTSWLKDVLWRSRIESIEYRAIVQSPTSGNKNVVGLGDCMIGRLGDCAIARLHDV